MEIGMTPRDEMRWMFEPDEEPDPYDPGPDDPGPNNPDPDEQQPVVHTGVQPVDWAEVWDSDGQEVDWIVEPLIAAGRLTALYSEAKVGKSLLILELAAALATGGIALSRPVKRRRVLIIDMENDLRGDVVQRLKAMGYAPHQLDDLVLFSLSGPATTRHQGRR